MHGILLQPCLDLRWLLRAGRPRDSYNDLWYFLSRESTKKCCHQAMYYFVIVNFGKVVSKNRFFSLALLLIKSTKNQARTELPPALKKQRKSSEPVALRGEMASYQRPVSRICSCFFIHPGAAPSFAQAHTPVPVLWWSRILGCCQMYDGRK